MRFCGSYLFIFSEHCKFMVVTRQGVVSSSNNMVRYKEMVKRKLVVEEEDPLTVTNKYRVWFRGLSFPSSVIEVPPPFTKRCRSSGMISYDEKREGEGKHFCPNLD